MAETEAAPKPAGMLHCNKCGTKTHHVVLAVSESSGSDPADLRAKRTARLRGQILSAS